MSEVTPGQPSDAPDTSDPTAPVTTKHRSAIANPLVLGLVVVVVAAVVVAVVASGGSPSRRAMPPAVAASQTAFTDAVRTTFADGTYSASFSLSVAIGSTDITATGTGGASATEHAGEFVENFSGSKQLDSVGPLTELVVGNSLYLKLGGALGATLPTPWVSTTLKGGASSLGGATPFKVPGIETKFVKQLPALLSSAKSLLHVFKTGTGTLDGVPVTNYESNFNTATVVATLRSEFPSEFVGVPSPKVAAEVTVNAAIDAQQRVRQLIVDIATTMGRPTTVKLTFTITSFGTAATYQAPPANEVTPLSALLARDHLSVSSSSTSVTR